MALLIVSAAASPLFGDFLIEVSVTDINGVPVSGLKPANFQIAHLASLNHAAANPRAVKSADEAPAGFYILQLKPNKIQPSLPPGHYVLAVAVMKGPQKKGGASDQGQTIAGGDII